MKNDERKSLPVCQVRNPRNAVPQSTVFIKSRVKSSRSTYVALFDHIALWTISKEAWSMNWCKHASSSSPGPAGTISASYKGSDLPIIANTTTIVTKLKRFGVVPHRMRFTTVYFQTSIQSTWTQHCCATYILSIYSSWWLITDQLITLHTVMNRIPYF